MLNLSDKELDRLSKEAAQEYEPGDVLGPQSWEKLEVHLDSSPGGFNPSPLRHIRRFPFYYAPALLVLIGVSYYFIKQGTKGSGSPPTFGMAKAPAPVEKNASSTTTNPVYPDKSTPLSSSTATPSSPVAPGGSDNPAGPSATTSANTPAVAADNKISSSAGNKAADKPGAASSNARSANGLTPRNATGLSSSNANGHNSRNATGLGSSNAAGLTPSGTLPPNARGATGFNAAANTAGSSGRRRSPGSGDRHGITGHSGSIGQTDFAAGNNSDAVRTRRGNTGANTGTIGSPSRELVRSATGSLASTKNRALIPDSNLRKFTLKSLPPGMRPRTMHINRDLQIGLVLAPDFSSVNSLSGNRPGSTIGLTVDYQFANRWYIGTGFLLDRKNYAAQSKDYHAPPDFYNSNFANHLDYVKGTFEMLEIPLNLRYDFSVTGSTLFFATAGVSSYLMTSENSSMYGNPWGFQSYQPWPVAGQHNYLFSAMDLSLGVETGLSNSLSLLIAPYMKIPTRGVGYGQVQMSSVGINFALKFAPVTSRKRK